jgi:hypothetical protein
MNRAKQKHCTCKVFGCINEQYKDPTRVDLPGRLLPYSTVQKHEQQEIIYQAQKRQNNLDAIFIAATMTDRMAVDDTSMLSGQIGDGTTANLVRVKFWFKYLQMEMIANGIMMELCQGRRLQMQKGARLVNVRTLRENVDDTIIDSIEQLRQ